MLDVDQRILETLFTQLSFYRTRELFAAKDWQAAATVLRIAVEIKPQRAGVWYKLACALARGRSPKKALSALGRAVEAGFSDAEILRNDPDLESIRDRVDFREILDQVARTESRGI